MDRGNFRQHRETKSHGQEVSWRNDRGRPRTGSHRRGLPRARCRAIPVRSSMPGLPGGGGDGSETAGSSSSRRNRDGRAGRRDPRSRTRTGDAPDRSTGRFHSAPSTAPGTFTPLHVDPPGVLLHTSGRALRVARMDVKLGRWPAPDAPDTPLRPCSHSRRSPYPPRCGGGVGSAPRPRRERPGSAVAGARRTPRLPPRETARGPSRRRAGGSGDGRGERAVHTDGHIESLAAHGAHPEPRRRIGGTRRHTSR